MRWEEEMRQIDEPGRLRRRAANLEFGRGSSTRVDPGVLARHIGGSPVCTRLAAGGRWIRTIGPAAKMDGRVRFRGRLTEMIKIGGGYVAPLEVEQVVLQHPDIVQAYVVGHS
jgi:acyl-CoA synthetase (AMP-forming)/AMP-acid ligase II